MIEKVVHGLFLFLSNGFVHVCILPMLYHFDCEIMMIDPMKLKIYMLIVDTLIEILALSLHISHFWLLSYDVINGGVTMCVTPSLLDLLIFVTMPFLCQLI